MSGELPEKALAVEFILRCVVSDNQDQADGLIDQAAKKLAKVVRTLGFFCAGVRIDIYELEEVPAEKTIAIQDRTLH